MGSTSKRDPKLDTGEQAAIAEAVGDALGRAARDAAQASTQRAVIAQVVAEYHGAHCPAQGLAGRLDVFVGEFKEFRGEIRGQLRMVMFGVPVILTLFGLLAAGVWTVATREPAKHSAVETGTVGGMSLISQARAETK